MDTFVPYSLLSTLFFLFLVLDCNPDRFVVQAAYVCCVDDSDVKGLSVLLDTFRPGDPTYYGDPCGGVLGPWDWVQCSSDTIPRITAIKAGPAYPKLTGSLPDFSSMDALETIDLSDNELTGSIPNFLGKIPMLEMLDLSNNRFSGQLPSSLRNTNIKLYVSGNPQLCISSTCNKGNDSVRNTPTTSDGSTSTQGDSPSSENSNSNGKNAKIIGSVVSGAVLLFAVVGVLALIQHKKNAAAAMAAQGKQGGNDIQPGGIALGAGFNGVMSNNQNGQYYQPTPERDHVPLR